MFSIDSEAVITNVVPRRGDADIFADVTVIVNAENGREALRSLHAPGLAQVCWNDAGEPQLSDFDIRIRHKVPNCAATFRHGDAKIFWESCDLANVKVIPLRRHALEINCKVIALASPSDIATLCAMWADEKCAVTIKEKQMSLEDAA